MSKVTIFLAGSGDKTVDVEEGMTVGELKGLINGASLIIRHEGEILEDNDAIPTGGGLVGSPAGKGA